MRDVLVTLIVFGLLPFVFKKPYIGALMWVWISVMNPHTQGWGFATTFPFAAIIAGVTMISLLASKEPKSLPLDACYRNFHRFHCLDERKHDFRFLS